MDDAFDFVGTVYDGKRRNLPLFHLPNRLSGKGSPADRDW
jgi:hypothetical protein